MMKKMIGLTAIAGLALTLSACDYFFGSKASTPPASNELVSNETSIGNSEEGFEDNASSNVASENATLVDNAGPATNTVGGNSN